MIMEKDRQSMLLINMNKVVGIIQLIRSLKLGIEYEN